MITKLYSNNNSSSVIRLWSLDSVLDEFALNRAYSIVTAGNYCDAREELPCALRNPSKLHIVIETPCTVYDYTLGEFALLIYLFILEILSYPNSQVPNSLYLRPRSAF